MTIINLNKPIYNYPVDTKLKYLSIHKAIREIGIYSHIFYVDSLWFKKGFDCLDSRVIFSMLCWITALSLEREESPNINLLSQGW